MNKQIRLLAEQAMEVVDVSEKLAMLRRVAKGNGREVPTGLVQDAQGFRQVQIDLA